MLDHAVSPSRRLSARVELTDIWAYWQYDGNAETSAVQNMSLGGLFLKTPKARPIGSRLELHLVVHDGQIRTGAVVRHVIPGRGLGLALTTIKNGDRPHFLALIDRVSNKSRLEYKGATLVQFLLRPSFSS